MRAKQTVTEENDVIDVSVQMKPRRKITPDPQVPMNAADSRKNGRSASRGLEGEGEAAEGGRGL